MCDATKILFVLHLLCKWKTVRRDPRGAPLGGQGPRQEALIKMSNFIGGVEEKKKGEKSKIKIAAIKEGIAAKRFTGDDREDRCEK